MQNDIEIRLEKAKNKLLRVLDTITDDDIKEEYIRKMVKQGIIEIHEALALINNQKSKQYNPYGSQMEYNMRIIINDRNPYRPNKKCIKVTTRNK